MTLRTVIFLAAAALTACDSTGPADDALDAPGADGRGEVGDDGSDAAGDTSVGVRVSYGEIMLPGEVTLRLGDDHVSLRPRIRVATQWQEPTACDVVEDGAEERALRCVFGGGEVRVAQHQREWSVAFTATSAVAVEGIELAGSGRLEGVRARMSNGFQSWSQSGVVAIDSPLNASHLDRALGQRGDDEVLRDGSGPSWFHSFAGGGRHAVVAGVTGPSPFRSWIELAVDAEGVFRARLAQGGAGGVIHLDIGDTIELAPWFVALGEGLTDILVEYGEMVDVLEHGASAERGWNSWYELWSDVDAAAVRANAEIARSALDGELRIVVDDGWQQAWGDWWPNEKFPDGLDGLADSLRRDGFEVGVWLAPLIAHEDSEIVSEHSDWFLPETTWRHVGEGRMRILDVTHPDAAAHLRETIERLVGWGMTLLKIDFLFAGTFEGDRQRAVTGMQAYDEALRIMREAAGEDVVLLAVGAPGVPSFPYVESWRLGPDIAVEPFGANWFFVPNELRSIGARWMLCGRVLCDADPPILRDLPRNEVELGAWVVGLAGGALFLSDDLRELPAERLEWLPRGAIEAATSGIYSRPIDLIPEEPPVRLANALGDALAAQNRHITPTLWQLPDGRVLHVNLTDATAPVGSRETAPRSARIVP